MNTTFRWYIVYNRWKNKNNIDNDLKPFLLFTPDIVLISSSKMTKWAQCLALSRWLTASLKNNMMMSYEVNFESTKKEEKDEKTWISGEVSNKGW